MDISCRGVVRVQCASFGTHLRGTALSAQLRGAPFDVDTCMLARMNGLLTLSRRESVSIICQILLVRRNSRQGLQSHMMVTGGAKGWESGGL